MAVLEVQGVTGGYSERRPVLQEVTFTVERGEMVGLIGLNGAGKSTTMKHILRLLLPHRGAVRVDGATLEERPETYRSAMAYVPESPLLYEEMTVLEHLRFTAMSYNVERSAAEARMEELLERFHMKEHRSKLPVQLSKGMKQKVMIMNAFLVKPKLYLIDEPFLGLDPLAIRALVALLLEEKKLGAGVLVSSHILPAIEPHCERFAVMHGGRLRVFGDLAEVKAAAGLQEGGGGLEDAFLRLVAGGERP